MGVSNRKPGCILLVVTILMVSQCLFAADLTNQLSRPLRQQTGGTCHLVSQVDLFEAACFRLTGKRINLSEAYLTHEHLKAALKDAARVNTLLSRKMGEHLTTFDGALPSDVRSLKRIMSGDVCVESEAESEKEYYNFLRERFRDAKEKAESVAWKPTKERTLNGAAIGLGTGVAAFLGTLIRDYLRTKTVPAWLDAYRERGCRGLLSQLAGKFLLFGLGSSAVGAAYSRDVNPPLREDHSGALGDLVKELEGEESRFFPVKRTKDPTALECIEGLSLADVPDLTHSEMNKLIDQGIPFACDGYFFSIPDRNIIVRGENFNEGNHSAVIVGNERQPDGSTKWFVRNAYGTPAKPYAIEEKGCPHAYILYSASEKAQLPERLRK